MLTGDMFSRNRIIYLLYNRVKCKFMVKYMRGIVSYIKRRSGRRLFLRSCLYVADSRAMLSLLGTYLEVIIAWFLASVCR